VTQTGAGEHTGRRASSRGGDEQTGDEQKGGQAKDKEAVGNSATARIMLFEFGLRHRSRQISHRHDTLFHKTKAHLFFSRKRIIQQNEVNESALRELQESDESKK
jgi:hypothetical protein